MVAVVQRCRLKDGAVEETVRTRYGKKSLDEACSGRLASKSDRSRVATESSDALFNEG